MGGERGSKIDSEMGNRDGIEGRERQRYLALECLFAYANANIRPAQWKVSADTKKSEHCRHLSGWSAWCTLVYMDLANRNQIPEC